MQGALYNVLFNWMILLNSSAECDGTQKNFRYQYFFRTNFSDTGTGTFFWDQIFPLPVLVLFSGPNFSGTGTIQRGAKFLGPECHSLLVGLCSHVKNLPHSFTLWHPLLPGGLEWSHICTICTYGSRWFTTVL